MFTVHFSTPDGYGSRVAQTMFDAVRVAQELEAEGARNIRIVDSDGDARSLAWWQSLISGAPPRKLP